MPAQNTPVAVVTGGARRIGKQIAEHLHQAGFNIVLTYRNSDADANALASTLNGERRGSCDIFACDFDDNADVNQLGEQLVECYRGIDLLVNNASGFSPTPMGNTTAEAFDNMQASNLRGAYFLIQAVLPALRFSRGSVVNILDMHLQRPLNGYSAYLAAKAGLASLTQSLAVELAPEVRVNGVSPGAILWPEDDVAYDEHTRENTLARTPLGRMGEPIDIARVVLFFAREAPFVTGQILTVDGGQSLT